MSRGSIVQGEACDIFLRMRTGRGGKLQGEAVAPGHEGEVDVLRWRWGASAGTAIGSSAPTSRRSYRHLEIVKRIDSASTGLLWALTTNDEVKEALLIMRKSGGEQVDFLTITLESARVVALDITCDDGGSTVETLSLAFNKVSVEYRLQESDGSLGASFSFEDEIVATS